MPERRLWGAPVAPPARLTETPPSTPSPLIWQPEHWSWTGTEYTWTPGHYVMGARRRPPLGCRINGQSGAAGWTWINGYWS